jgi:hypothetical protein
MDRTEAIRWVLTVAAGLRLSQAKTLGDLVASTLWVGRVTLAAIGQHLSGSSFAKHRIKRVWRFTSNERVVPSDVMQGVIDRLMRRRWNRSKPLLVALDWTDIRGFCTLMAAAVIKGRAIPLVWASYPKWNLVKSQNNLEEGMLVLLRAMIPQHVPVILLADRGFGRTEFARACQKQGFHYVIRVRPEVWVRCPAYQGSLQDYPLRKGMRRMLRDVAFRKEKPVSQHVVIRWKPGLPKRRDEPWFLMTDLDRSPVALSDLYGRRMTIEELFRDSKNRRNGFALRNTQITRASRLDRLILIVALAYILLVGLGLSVRQHHPPGFWCSSNNPRQCSAFTIGRKILDRVAISIEVILRQLVASLLEASPNWG